MLPLNNLISAAARCSQLDRMEGTNCGLSSIMAHYTWEYFKLSWLAPQDHRRNTWIHVFQNHTTGVEPGTNVRILHGILQPSPWRFHVELSERVPHGTIGHVSKSKMKSFPFKKQMYYFIARVHSTERQCFHLRAPSGLFLVFPVTPFLAFRLITS